MRSPAAPARWIATTVTGNAATAVHAASDGGKRSPAAGCAAAGHIAAGRAAAAEAGG